jgi:serine/threonine protein kinase
MCRDELTGGSSMSDEGVNEVANAPTQRPAFPIPGSAAIYQHLLPPGHVVDCYTIKRVIGSGAFGTVYEAMQDNPRRTVALKVMKPSSGPSAWRRFQLEVDILGQIQHPGIAKVFGAGVHEFAGSVPYFALEYIPDARTITEYAREKKLDVRQKLELFAQVCDAVYAANLRGVIHRDLKPANILVDVHGQPKVIDFGVARVGDSDQVAVSQQTNVGELVGTVAYMSPEQVEGDPHGLDIRSDVYSLGVVLFELLAGELPHPVLGLAAFQAARIIVEQPPRRISKINPELRGELERIVHAALHSDRRYRYQSADDLAKNLRAFLNGQPTWTPQRSLTETIRSHANASIRKHPVVAYAAALAAAFVIVEYLGFTVIHHWTDLDTKYFNLIQHVVASPVLNQPLEKVRGIALTDDTIAALPRIAETYGLHDVDWNNRASLRRVHKVLCEKLATAEPRAVVLDFTFRGESPFDDDLCEGIDSLKKAGIDVIASFEMDDAGHCTVSKTIAEKIKFGWPGAGLDVQPWAIELVFQHERTEPIPSIALAAFAATRKPGIPYTVSIENSALGADLQYYQVLDGSSNVRQLLGDGEHLRTTENQYFDPARLDNGSSAAGRKKGDLLALYEMPVVDANVFDAATVEYEHILSMSPAELKSNVGGKVVVIGYATEDGEEFRARIGEEFYPNVFVHMLAIESLLSGKATQFEYELLSQAGMVLFGFVGVMAPIAAPVSLTRHRRTFIMLGVLLASIVITVAISTLVLAKFQYLFDPMMPVTTCLLAMIIGRHITHIRAGYAPASGGFHDHL